MRRGILVAWHAATLVVAACLYFFFVLPRWPEFAGHTPHTLGTVMRIATGALVAQAAVLVLIDLGKRRPPEFGAPQLALALRQWSAVGQALAGLLIIAAAVAEIWVRLDAVGQILFGVYGAAAALAVVAAGAFYLAFAAETTPAPPKPLKPRPDGITEDPPPTATAETDHPGDLTPKEEPRSGLRNRRQRKQQSDVAVSD